MAKTISKIKLIITLFSLAVILSSCATAPVIPPPTREVYPHLTGPIIRQDILHIVAPGETLWRISKMYDVKINEIMRANHLSSDRLKMGQELIIPEGAPLRPVIPLYSSNKWRYIVIHHSATDEGSALSLFKLHKQRGFSEGLGYHFTIANGTCGKKDGQIEISPRWIKQEDGAHCRAAGMNHEGIGICLVGNFSQERVSQKQMDALAYLVNTLKKYYRIPKMNILGHGQVPGAHTECPGNYFPWREFRTKLNSE